MTALRILAGPKAYQHILKNGLSPRHIAAVFGASGAAKWLAIYGLDKAIFSQWLIHSDHPIDLFGTSVGAFKLAAAAQADPAAALTCLANAYIDQHYKGKIEAKQVTAETRRILASFLTEQGIHEVLTSPRFNYHCASVRCQGLLASKNITPQKVAMVRAFLLSFVGRDHLRSTFQRNIFYSGSPSHNFDGSDTFSTYKTALTAENFLQAVLSSGSIPVVMPGVTSIEGAEKGVYRDGGLLDYHAVPCNVAEISSGLVLYPHFYSYIKETWFDKFFPWRKVKASQLDNVVIVSPSESFVNSLPGGVIPDRGDFYRFQNNDQERVARWIEAKDRSNELGAAFIQLAESGGIASVVEPL